MSEINSKRAMSEPVAFEYQHEDTGLIGYVDQWQIDHGFFENNPRLQLIGPLYRHPSDLEQQLTAANARAEALENAVPDYQVVKAAKKLADAEYVGQPWEPFWDWAWKTAIAALEGGE